ncbi:hypothetical protein HDU82_008790 [Entophlyctis luteolus]|nr:hypothetical protein HDU82_008790 [Entophlyctis luteolus]
MSSLLKNRASRRADRADAEARLPLLASSASDSSRIGGRRESPSPPRDPTDADALFTAPHGHDYRDKQQQLRFTFHRFLIALTAVVVLLLAVDAVVVRRSNVQTSAISAESFSEGLNACERISRDEIDSGTSNPALNRPLLIQHATVWDGIGGRMPNTDVALAFGVIVKIGQGLSSLDVVNAAKDYRDKLSNLKNAHEFSLFNSSDVEIVDVQGRVVSPGLIDMHSHVGAGSIPGFSGEEDTNEMAGGPTNPQLKILDSINPLDKAIDLIAMGGVTTSLVMPGSGTLMGGEGIAIKMLKTSSNSADDLSLNLGMASDSSDGKLWRWMKMACGENPKRVFSSKGMMPASRMGSGWLFRQRLDEAKTLRDSQDNWCEAANILDQKFKGKAYKYVAQEFPIDLSNESLVSLLPSKLAHENISVAIFADHSLYKREAYKHSVRAGQILSSAGAKVAYKSDHPVLNAQHLVYEAQKSAHYGLDEDLAFMAVTSIPADRIGAGWRIGRISEGYDADVLIWNRPPLSLGAHPLRVIIDGYTINSLPLLQTEPSQPAPVPGVTPSLPAPHTHVHTYTIANISGIYTKPGEILKGSLIVENGLVACIGPKCSAKGTLFDLQGGVVIPGLIGAAVPLGLEEIGMEDSTTDGNAGTENALAGLVSAKDGLRVGGGGKLLEYAWRSGVLTGIAAPTGSGVVQGISVAFRTAAQKYSDAILKSDVALHISIGDYAKGKSISSQLAHLRSWLAAPKAETPFSDVVSGKLPLVATVHDPNDISKLLGIVSSVAPKARLVLAGATGAWVVADEIATAKVPVLLLPPRCQQETWETRWCRPYGTSSQSTYEILASAGVKVLFSVREPDQIRSLLFEAGWGTVGDSESTGTVNAMDAVGVVTWNVADAFGLDEGVGRIVVGKRASFVGLDGGPVGFGYRIQILADGSEVTTQPLQD